MNMRILQIALLKLGIPGLCAILCIGGRSAYVVVHVLEKAHVHVHVHVHVYNTACFIGPVL